MVLKPSVRLLWYNTVNQLRSAGRRYERRQAIRLVGVRFSDLVPGASQLNLFDDTERESQLLAAMDRIRKRFGKGAIGKG